MIYIKVNIEITLMFSNPFETQQPELLVVTVSYSHLPGYIQISVIMTNNQSPKQKCIAN